MPERIVVVGASLAGLRAAQACRAAGHEGSLTVVGDEQHPPYQRPPLSKDLLSGAKTREAIDFALGDLDVEWHLGVPASGLEPAGRTVVLADGATVGYDRLVVATGTTARRWPGEGGDLDGVLTVRTVDDAQDLGSRLAVGTRLVVVGAGFLGCEVAAVAVSLGCDVTLCDVASHPMSVLGPDVGTAYAALHRSRGVRLVTDAAVDGFEGTEGVEQVRFADGSTIGADVVLVALGAVPATSWLDGSGLPLDDGVVCDETLTVEGFPEIMAAGDVARWLHPLGGGAGVRVEHFNTAGQQGKHVGTNVLQSHEAREAFVTVPSAWSDQHDMNLQTIGLPGLGTASVVVEGSVAEHRFVAAATRGELVVGVTIVGAPGRARAYRKLFAAPSRIPRRSALATMLSADSKALPVSSAV